MARPLMQMMWMDRLIMANLDAWKLMSNWNRQSKFILVSIRKDHLLLTLGPQPWTTVKSKTKEIISGKVPKLKRRTVFTVWQHRRNIVSITRPYIHFQARKSLQNQDKQLLKMQSCLLWGWRIVKVELIKQMLPQRYSLQWTPRLCSSSKRRIKKPCWWLTGITLHKEMHMKISVKSKLNWKWDSNLIIKMIPKKSTRLPLLSRWKWMPNNLLRVLLRRISLRESFNIKWN